jgi:uncharacterized protein
MRQQLIFQPAERFAAAAKEFEKHRKAIRRRLPEVEVRHVGGTSLPGALTKGDLAVQVRVAPERFKAAVSELEGLYEPRLPDTWDDEFATFSASCEALPEDTGISVAVIGSRYDRFGAELWDRLSSEPELLTAYNALKTKHAAGDRQPYEEAKAEVFAAVLEDGEQ